MDSIRNAVVRCLRENSSDSVRFHSNLGLLVQQEGDVVFPILINVLTHLNFSTHEARKNWAEIVCHQEEMGALLGRPVTLATAACDFFSSINQSLHNPKVIEFEIFEKTEKLSKCDGLTGLFNRGYFDQAMDMEIKRAKRYNQEFSLVIFDLDNFKKVNDEIGHLAGDIALRNVAALINAEKRTEDIVARYGGEEIVLILPQTLKFDALIIADRIRQKIGKVVMQYKDTFFQITTSGGVACYPIDGTDSNGMIQSADEALYEAKSRGKNCICLHTRNKRQFLRIDFADEIKINEIEKPDIKASYKAKNVSGSGILFSSAKAFALATEIEITIATGEASQPIHLTGQVMRVEKFDDSFDIGVRFLKIPDHENSETATAFAQYLKIPLDN